MGKTRLSSEIPREWTAYAAETIENEFERVYALFEALPDSLASIAAFTSDQLGPGALIVGNPSGSGGWTTLPFVSTAQRALTNDGAGIPAWAQISLTTGVTGTLPATNGGTGTATVAQGDLLYGSATDTWAKLTKDANATRYLSNTGTSNNPAWAQVNLTNGVTGVLPAANGGTGQSAYDQGDILYASAATTLSKLAKSTAAFAILTNQGASNNPSWVTAPEILTADRTYYVRTDGSDSNTGLVDSAGGAFLTIQKGIDTAVALSLGIYNVTIQVRTGTFAPCTLKSFVAASGRIILQGDTTTPSNVIIDNSTAATHCVTHNTSVRSYWKITGFKLTNSGSGASDGIGMFNSFIEVGVLELGAITRYAFNVNQATVINTGNLTFSGNTQRGVFGQGNATWNQSGALTYTFTGTPAWTTAFVYAAGPCFLGFFGTISGAATGKRYLAELNGVIQTFGGGANYFPGDVAGTTATGGQYN